MVIGDGDYDGNHYGVDGNHYGVDGDYDGNHYGDDVIKMKMVINNHGDW